MPGTKWGIAPLALDASPIAPIPARHHPLLENLVEYGAMKCFPLPRGEERRTPGPYDGQLAPRGGKTAGPSRCDGSAERRRRLRAQSDKIPRRAEGSIQGPGREVPGRRQGVAQQPAIFTQWAFNGAAHGAHPGIEPTGPVPPTPSYPRTSPALRSAPDSLARCCWWTGSEPRRWASPPPALPP